MKSVKTFWNDYGALAATCVVVFVLHIISNANYGFHRDELQFIADSRHLAAGFVAYPPVTPVMAFLARVLFGESLVAYRVFSAIAHSLIVLIAGLMAKELGGLSFSRVFSALLSLAFLGAVFLLARRDVASFRSAVVWVLVTIALFVAMKGRGYYTGALYLPLTAAGAVATERFVAARASFFRRVALSAALMVLYVLNAAVTLAMALPFAPRGSAWFYLIASLNDSFNEQFGWEELAADVAAIRDSLPEAERSRFGILAGNYGEAGALEFYGRAYGLPKIMCVTNSFYDRGYDEAEPEIVVVTGVDRERLESIFESVEVAARARNALGVANEETKLFSEIFLCRKPKFRWSELWKGNRRFG